MRFSIRQTSPCEIAGHFRICDGLRLNGTVLRSLCCAPSVTAVFNCSIVALRSITSSILYGTGTSRNFSNCTCGTSPILHQHLVGRCPVELDWIHELFLELDLWCRVGLVWNGLDEGIRVGSSVERALRAGAPLPCQQLSEHFCGSWTPCGVRPVRLSCLGHPRPPSRHWCTVGVPVCPRCPGWHCGRTPTLVRSVGVVLCCESCVGLCSHEEYQQRHLHF